MMQPRRLALEAATRIVQDASDRGYAVSVSHNSNGHAVKRDTMREKLAACLDRGIRLFIYTQQPSNRLAVDRYFTVQVLHWHPDVVVLPGWFGRNEEADAIEDCLAVARAMVRAVRPIPDNVINLTVKRELRS